MFLLVRLLSVRIRALAALSTTAHEASGSCRSRVPGDARRRSAAGARAGASFPSDCSAGSYALDPRNVRSEILKPLGGGPANRLRATGPKQSPASAPPLGGGGRRGRLGKACRVATLIATRLTELLDVALIDHRRTKPETQRDQDFDACCRLADTARHETISGAAWQTSPSPSWCTGVRGRRLCLRSSWNG